MVGATIWWAPSAHPCLVAVSGLDRRWRLRLTRLFAGLAQSTFLVEFSFWSGIYASSDTPPLSGLPRALVVLTVGAQLIRAPRPGARYHRRMTAEPVSGMFPTSPAPSTPREIRQALLPEEAGQFDSEWRTAMSRSAESLDLTEVYRVLNRWRSIATMTRHDPEAHRRMLRRAESTLTGEQHGTVTAADQRAMIARRLGR